jgi:hypothetical protein
MKKTLITAAALVACAGTQLFAQNIKEDVMTFNLTRQYQISVSTSASANNAGTWDAPPTQYKTKSSKLNTADILRSIAVVLYGNANAYSSQAKLVLVQGELSGFFGLRTPLETNPLYTNSIRTITVGSNSFEAIGKFYAGGPQTTPASLFYRLDTGRNFDANPDDGRLAVGHDQPWGQVFVKDQNGAVCDNVTFFFRFYVQECYDCFYLNSFISDAKFAFKDKAGPPCCAGTTANSASGKDRYFMWIDFDNTIQNPYLDPESSEYVGWVGGPYPNIEGLYELDNGVDPDALTYDPAIFNNVANPEDQHPYDIYVMRFEIGGIVTYTWTLKLINPTDPIQEFLGTAQYPAYGYGYIGKVCSFLTGTASFAEKSAKSTTCCTDTPWYDSWYGVGSGYTYGTDSEINVPEALTYHEQPYGIGD